MKPVVVSRATKIDYSDIAQTRPDDWQHAVQGHFLRPSKRRVTVAIDRDVLDWLRSQGRNYKARINNLLRECMKQSVNGSGGTSSEP